MEPNILDLQTVSGFQYQNFDPYRRSYKLLAMAMLSCFVNDIDSYKRMKIRKKNQCNITTTMQWHHDQIRAAYASALMWARDQSDYFLSIRSCAEAVGVDVEEFLTRVLVDEEK
jgi:hypothetical protein